MAAECKGHRLIPTLHRGTTYDAASERIRLIEVAVWLLLILVATAVPRILIRFFALDRRSLRNANGPVEWLNIAKGGPDSPADTLRPSKAQLTVSVGKPMTLS